MRGGDGADILRGGAGRDLLYGNLADGTSDGDQDKFDFDAITESGLTSTTRDWILDFTDVVDRIDVSTIDANTAVAGNQTFAAAFVAAFTVAGAQIKATQSGGNVLVEFNTDSDTAAEFSLMVRNITVANLTAADFIL